MGSSIASVQPKVTIEKLPTTTTYKVKLGYDTATGLVCDIVVYPTTAFSNATDFSIKCDNRPAVT